MAKEITIEIKKELGDVGKMKLRYVSWNGADPKFDLRSWYTDSNGEEKCNKGLTLTKEELQALYDLIPDAIKAIEAPEEKPDAKPKAKRTAKKKTAA